MLINGCAMSPGNILIRFCTGIMVFFYSDLDGESRTAGDCHVRFCERFRGEIPLCLLDFVLSTTENIIINIAAINAIVEPKSKGAYEFTLSYSNPAIKLAGNKVIPRMA